MNHAINTLEEKIKPGILFQYFSIACDEFATETSGNMVNTISYQVKKENKWWYTAWMFEGGKGKKKWELLGQ